MEQTNIPQLEKYEKFLFRRRLALIVAAIATVVAALCSAGAGTLHFPFSEILRTLLGKGTPQANTVLFGIRLPRIAAGLLVGGLLASSGAVMQCVLRNPLASASTLGVSQGAAFGAAIGIIVFGGGAVNSPSAAAAVTVSNPFTVTLCAFLFGSMSTFVVIAISRFKKSIGPGGLVLAGTALSSLFAGGSTLLQYFADETKLGAVVFWTFGDLGGSSWWEIGFLAAVFAASMLFFLLNRWNYNAMEGGADTAKSLGVNTRSVMLWSMVICSLTASISVSFVGIISFVGLIAPHIMRRFVGNDYRYLVPCSAVAGALLLVLADTFARTVIAPVILPIGAITSFLGGPVFLMLLFKGGVGHGKD